MVTSWDSQKIKSLRLRLGWTAARLAQRIGCTTQEVLVWEQGQRLPDPEYVQHLSNLNVQIESYTLQVQSDPLAETVLSDNNWDQVTDDDLKNFSS